MVSYFLLLGHRMHIDQDTQCLSQTKIVLIIFKTHRAFGFRSIFCVEKQISDPSIIYNVFQVERST